MSATALIPIHGKILILEDIDMAATKPLVGLARQNINALTLPIEKYMLAHVPNISVDGLRQFLAERYNVSHDKAVEQWAAVAFERVVPRMSVLVLMVFRFWLHYPNPHYSTFLFWLSTQHEDFLVTENDFTRAWKTAEPLRAFVLECEE